MLRLGLIGDNIAASRAPRLHETAGRLCGIEAKYERLCPPGMGQSAAEVFAGAAADGFQGLNITYPYKEAALDWVVELGADVGDLGAINTVVFTDSGPVGWNTDLTGFVAAYRAVRGRQATGRVAVVGAGGVGRAVVHGLRELGAEAIVITDVDPARAATLAGEVGATAASDLHVAGPFTGVLNCSPVGMDGLPGCPVPGSLIAGASWAFDAVYTPAETEFLALARAAGLQCLSGVELFFWQGVHAWKHFSGLDIDPSALRQAMDL